MDTDIYEGRLVADGNGNLLADEGPRAGEPVAEHEGSYVFIKSGEASHNERHHKQYLEFGGTTDESNEGEAHHLSPEKGDPHYDEDTENHTRLRFSPDATAGTETGHTKAYVGRRGDDSE